jgi:hypothetical protein
MLAVDEHPGRLGVRLRDRARVEKSWCGEPDAEGGLAGFEGGEEGVRGHRDMSVVGESRRVST